MNTRTQKNIIALKTILDKEITRFVRIWSQTILPPAITMTLYFIIFGKLIGTQLNSIHGFSYMEYIVPGLVMMSIMTNAYANTASSFFSAKFTRSIEEMLVSPMPSLVILLGFTLGGMLRGIAVGAVVLFISLFFTHLPVHNISLAVLMAFLSAMLFSLAGLLNGIFAKNFDDVSFIPTFVLTPLSYLGGVFYSVHQLPETWQKISLLNPILNIVDTFRFGILGISDVNIYFSLALVTTLFLALFIGCLYLLKKGVGIRT